jgi:hypothetical protein
MLQQDVVSTTRYIPVGSIVEGREGPRPDVPGVEWGPVSTTANGVPITPDETGLFVLPSEAMTSGAVIAVEVTNTAALAPIGAFSVTKTVAGPSAAEVPADTVFALEYTVDDGPVQTATIGVGETFTVDDVAGGATLRIRETSPPGIADTTWSPPAWSLDGETLEPDAGGWVSVRVEPGSTLALSLVNWISPSGLPFTGGVVPVVPALVGLGMILLGIALVARRVRRPGAGAAVNESLSR